MHTQKSSSRSTSFLIGTLVVVVAMVTATRFNLVDQFAYAVEKGRLRATAEELAQVEQADRVIGMVADLVRPAVVNIVTTSGGDEVPARRLEDLPESLRRILPPGFKMPQRQRQPRRGIGSGVIIDAEKGYILTNNHVIEGADRLEVSLHDHRKFEGKLIGADEMTDLAVIQISPERLHALELGDSDAMFVGATVLAVGSPFQHEQTVTKGIVSAKGRASVMNTLRLRYQDFIQTDAAINPGNSGGPLVNLRGQVIGINTVIATSGNVGGSMGVGFAISSSMIKEILPRLIEGKAIVRGYLGVWIQNLSKDPGLAEELGLKDDRGVLITTVPEDGPGAEAGLRRWDVVLSIDGKRANTVTELMNRVAMTPPGETLAMGIWRDGKEKNVSVKVGELTDDITKPSARPSRIERADPGTAEADDLGITVSELTAELAEKYEWDAEEDMGVVVTEVKAGSAAWNEGIRPGDLIQEISRKPVRSVKDFRRLLKGRTLARGVVMFVMGKQEAGRAVYLRLR